MIILWFREGGSHASAWHMRRLDHGEAAGELDPADRTALRAAMVERARQSFARAAGDVHVRSRISDRADS
jgi:hypothetical protein